jgi:type IV secretory pathway VirB2 component (pilin)
MLHNRFLRLGTIGALICVSFAGPALAGSGGNLPWEGPLEQIQQSITGPVAGYIALAAVAIAGGMLIFGGELNDFARRLMYVVLVAGILLGATTIVGLFWLDRRFDRWLVCRRANRGPECKSGRGRGGASWLTQAPGFIATGSIALCRGQTS